MSLYLYHSKDLKSRNCEDQQYQYFRLLCIGRHSCSLDLSLERLSKISRHLGIIGGHCVIPNLELVHDQTLDLIKKFNNMYEKKSKRTNSSKK